MIEYLFLAAGLIAVVRLCLGPSFADRMISAGAFINILVVLIAIHAVSIGSDFYLDIAILMILLSFTGTLAVAKYMGDENI
jgi:multicomponent Na+:H+ antiporter subunit F